MNDRLVTFLQSKRNRVLSIILVVTMHVGAIGFLVEALSTKHVEQHPAPMPIVVEVPSASSAAAEAAPPPPPEMITPPPPTLPPPKLNINIPPPPKVAKPQPKPKHVAKPVPTPSHAEAGPVNPNATHATANPGKSMVPTHSTAGDHSVSAQPISGGKPEYPPEMEEQNREGKVRIKCDIDTQGKPMNCNVLSSSGGQAFVESTLKFLTEKARYRPEVRNGVPVVSQIIYNFNFQL